MVYAGCLEKWEFALMHITIINHARAGYQAQKLQIRTV